MSKWRQYRAIEPDEFILAFGDCSQGGEDSNFCQFMSATRLDFPLVYQARGVAVTMTQDLFPILEKIYDQTGIPPVIALERNNGGQSEMQRLYDLNVKNKYRCFVMPNWGNVGVGAEETTLLGWNTDKATRPKMLGEWKSVFEKHLFRIYDEETIKQHKSFIIKNGKAQAASHRHDDGVISCFIKGTFVLTNKGNIPIERIKVGDLVLTRNGYQPVVKTFKSKKEVISRFGLVGTPNHPFITKNGNKDFQSLLDSDTLYMWKEKLLSIKVKHITATQTLKDYNIGFTFGNTINGKLHQLLSIVKYGLITLAIYLKAILFTIKMVILSIIHWIILKLLKMVFTQKDICCHQKEENNQEKLAEINQKELLDNLQSGERNQKQKSFIEKMLSRIFCWKWLERLSVWSVVKILQLNVNVKQNTVLNYAKVEQTKKHEKREIKTVYNLTIDNFPEYFANNILVHNCAGAYQLFQNCKPEGAGVGGSSNKTPTPTWVDKLPSWNTQWK